MNTNQNHCTDCGLRGGCACLWQSATQCKRCAQTTQFEERIENEAQLALQLAPQTARILDFYHSSCGIGDAVCALYAACGAANAGLTVRFHTHQALWLTRMTHPGVVVLDDGHQPATDIHRDYGEQLGRAECRKTWFARILASDAGAKPFAPAVPRAIERTICERRVDFEGDYVVFSPYSAWQARCWPVSHWARLAELLVGRGRRVVMIDGVSHDETPRLLRDFSDLPAQVSFAWGHGPNYITDLMLGAVAFVGNDSGMTHLAGALGVKTLAIHAALPPEMLWSSTDIVPLTPQTDCAVCRWQGARGWTSSCDSRGCSALSSIAPERVLGTLAENLGIIQ